MAEPFVFHFRAGPKRRPEVMYMLDLDCRCPLCFHEQVQRFYHSTSFHELTLVGLDELADSGALKAGYRCENCGEAVGSVDVRNTVLTYGFADDAGLLRIFHDLKARRRRYEVTACRRLDPQEQPRWGADPDFHSHDHHVLEELREPDVERLLNRPFNPKLAVRDALESALDDGTTERILRISPDMWLLISRGDTSPDEIIKNRGDDDLLRAGEEDSLQTIDLLDSAPNATPLGQDPTKLPGRWGTWLPDAIVDALRYDDLSALFFVDPENAIAVVERTFEVARVDYTRQESVDDLRFVDLTTPTEILFPRELSTANILRRAVFTGLTPGESARLSAEEVVGALLDVW